MKLLISTKSVALSLLGFVCMTGQVGVAQNNDTENNALVLEEIVVTARKREESLNDVPITINAITGEDIFQAGHNNLEDFAQGIANVNLVADSNTRARFSVRGIGPDVSGIQGPGVGFFIDGVYQVSTGSLNTPFFDLERVEILKGPQGSLYGRNSLGGVVNFVTPKPGDEFNASVGAEVASFGTTSLAGAVGGALVEDQLYGRLSFQTRSTDGPYDNIVSGEPAYPLDSDQIRGRLVWEATDNLELDLTANYAEVDGTSFIYAPVSNIQNLSDVYAGDPESRSNTETTDVAFIATYSFENFDLRSQTSYHQQDWDYEVDADTGPAFLLRVANPADFEVKSQEFRLISTEDGPLQWLVGVEYAKTSIESVSTIFGPFIDFFTTLPNSAVGSITTSERELYAGFFDLAYELNDKVELSFGLRYDDVDSVLFGVNTFSFPVETILSATPFPDSTITQQEWQPKVSVTVDWTDTVTTFAAASKGFREGGFNQNAAGTPLDSWSGDSVWNYEVGLRWQDADGRAQFDVAAFYIDWQDATGSVLFGPGATGVVNFGDAESSGLEASGKFAVNENLTLFATAAVLDCEYKEVNLPAGLTGSQGVFEGDQCVYSSDWNFSVGGDYTYPLGDSGFDLTANLNVLGRGDTKAGFHTVIDESRTTQDAYYLTNLSVGVQNKAYSVILFADNLTDEQYAVNVTSVDLGAQFGVQSDNVLLGAPATYGLRVRANF